KLTFVGTPRVHLATTHRCHQLTAENHPEQNPQPPSLNRESNPQIAASSEREPPPSRAIIFSAMKPAQQRHQQLQLPRRDANLFHHRTQ
ncbi:hypothetical protein VIGAN_04236300, partial [Vigna angularis var. angularis]